MSCLSISVSSHPCQAYLHIDDGHLRLYILLSGLLVWIVTKKEVNLCEGLEWKRSLALHLWYVCVCVCLCIHVCVYVRACVHVSLLSPHTLPSSYTYSPPCGCALSVPSRFVCPPTADVEESVRMFEKGYQVSIYWQQYDLGAVAYGEFKTL